MALPDIEYGVSQIVEIFNANQTKQNSSGKTGLECFKAPPHSLEYTVGSVHYSIVDDATSH